MKQQHFRTTDIELERTKRDTKGNQATCKRGGGSRVARKKKLSKRNYIPGSDLKITCI